MRRRIKRRNRREGFVIWMVVMLVVTATVAAMFALHFTMTDLRSAGAEERMRETNTVAEASVECLISSYERTNYQDLMTEYRATEQLADTQGSAVARALHVEFEGRDVAGDALSACIGTDEDVGNSFGPGRSYVPRIRVDVTDLAIVDAEAGELAGERADGEGGFVFVSATLTGAATATPVDAVDDATSESNDYALRAGARANILFGPIPR